MSLKEFLDEKMPLVERLDRFLYSGSLLDKITESYSRTGDRKQAIKDRVKPFFDNVIPFGEYVKLSDKGEWEKMIQQIYMEQNNGY